MGAPERVLPVYIRESFGQRLYTGWSEAEAELGDGLIYTGRHTFRCHASSARASAAVRSPKEDFFEKSSGQILPSGPLREV